MKENTQEKSLVQINEKNIFYKIKKFFINLFNRIKTIDELNIVKNHIYNDSEKENIQKSFIESIKNIEDDETKLLELQKKYRSGEIREEDLTEEEVNLLCSLYDRQIDSLRKSNEMRKQRLLEYRRKLKTDN